MRSQITATPATDHTKSSKRMTHSSWIRLRIVSQVIEFRRVIARRLFVQLLRYNATMSQGGPGASLPRFGRQLLAAGLILDAAELACCGLPLVLWMRNLPWEMLWLKVALPLTLAVNENRRARGRGDLARCEDVIEVAVGVQDLRDGHPHVLDGRKNIFRVATGIDDCGFPGWRESHNGAVAGHGPNRERMYLHGGHLGAKYSACGELGPDPNPNARVVHDRVGGAGPSGPPSPPPCHLGLRPRPRPA